MSSRDIIVKTDAAGLSSYAAQLFISIGGEAIRASGSFSVSLAGGSTPRKLYSLLATDAHRTALDWSKVVFFLGDERNVPPDSAESNFRMANDTLLKPLAIPPQQIFRWRTEIRDPLWVADQYDGVLREHITASGKGLDLVLLGLGTDGHTASLFPGTSALRERERGAVANWVERLDDHRLTMTFSMINASSNVIFLVSGTEKASVVAQVIEGEFRPDDYPAQYVMPENGSLYWLLDGAAASGLRDSI